MPEFAAHAEPLLRAEADFLIQVDLEPWGMPDAAEQLWVRRLDEDRFVVCCLPFFSYGIALGDVVAVREDEALGIVFDRVLEKSGHRLLRFAFFDKETARASHEDLHRRLAQAAIRHEWHQAGYGAIDLAEPQDEPRAMKILAPMLDAGTLSVEID